MIAIWDRIGLDGIVGGSSRVAPISDSDRRRGSVAALASAGNWACRQRTCTIVYAALWYHRDMVSLASFGTIGGAD